MNICPYCGESLEKEHPLVGYIGDSAQGISVRECKETGQRFKKDLSGKAAQEAKEEYQKIRPESGEDVIPEEEGKGLWRKFLEIVSKI